jgi:F-type H+-transporting ATPase subunit delta
MASLKNIRVSARYAKALFDLAVEYKLLEEVKNDMELVTETVEASRDLLLVFRSPLVSVSKKVIILNTLFQSSISELSLRFLVLITRKGRIVCLDEIADSYLKMYKKHLNITTVSIEFASSIDASIKEKIKSIMASHTGAKIELLSAINPYLIGGFRLYYEDYMFDASLKNKLIKMRKEFEKNIYERKF